MSTSIHPLDPFDAFITRDAVVLQSLARLRSWSKSPVGLLLTGEAGVGKSFAARLLHLASGSPSSSFVTRSAAEPDLPASLRATLEQDAGTLVLDGLEHWSLESQAALVHQLVSCTGASVRIIGMSRISMARLYREDRLHPLLARQWANRVVEIPPLRARLDDLAPLIEGMLRRARREAVQLHATTWRALATHGWPGNVRELRRTIDAALTQAVDGVIEPRHLVLDRLAPPSLEALGELPFMAMRQAVDAWYLRRLLHETNDNLSEAARRSACSRKVLRERLRRHGLYRAGWTAIAEPAVALPGAEEGLRRSLLVAVASPQGVSESVSVSVSVACPSASGVVAAEERVVPWPSARLGRRLEPPRAAA